MSNPDRDFSILNRDLGVVEEHVKVLHDALRMQAEGALKLVDACRSLSERLEAINKRLEVLEEDASDQHTVVIELNKAYENLLARVQRLEDRLCATIRRAG